MSEITKAIQHLCDEKGLEQEAVMEAVELALAAAYRKDFGNRQQNIKVKFDPETGDMKVWDVKTVVEDISEEDLEAGQEKLTELREKAREEERELTEEEIADIPRFSPKNEIMLAEAKEISKKAKVGDVLEIPLEVPSDFGRMAAQTAKQVIIQKIREAERGMVFEDFKEQEGELITGTIQRVEGKKVLVDFGKVTGVLPSEQRIPRDIYRPGQRMKFLLLSVEMGARGLEIILSRADKKFVEAIFSQEIPEIAEGVIEIKGIARDAGFRSKVAVVANDDSIDPIGSCIGQRGGRINTIIEELGGEKIDVIQYSEDPKEYIKNALAPAKLSDLELDEENKAAIATISAEQLSLAIGRGGQNVRLAGDLTGWHIKIKEEGKELEEDVAGEEEPAEEAKEEEGKNIEISSNETAETEEEDKE